MDCNRAQTKDPDEWLESRSDFSRPLCTKLREWVFRWQPDLTEAIKWNMLCFSGRKLVCGISGCQRHVGISFFRGTELPDPAGLFTGGDENTAIRSIRLTSLESLHRDSLRGLLHAAVALDSQPELAPPPKVKREPWPMPDFFAEELAKKKHTRAAEGFAKLSPTCQREWLVWLSTAKREETRASRLERTLKTLALGGKWIDRNQT
jgi:hypothetical protein